MTAADPRNPADKVELLEVTTRADVKRMKKALDAGWILHASVVSGFALDTVPSTPLAGGKKGIHRAEHYIEIIGYRDDVFLFWDPDAVTSAQLGGGFGYLFVDAATGRLWTYDSFSTNLTGAAPGGGSDRGYVRVQGKSQHTYQVISVMSK